MTKLCNSCEYLKYCARSGIEEVGCDRYKRDTTTNEEWFCALPTEEKAEFLNLIIRVGPYENEPKDFWECVYGRGGDCGAKSIVEWLKQPHTKE